MKTKTKVVLAVSYAIFFLPRIAGAWQVESVFGVTIDSSNGSILSNYLGVFLSFIYGISGSLIILRLVSAGFMYIQAQGNPNQVEMAKKRVKKALEGLAIVFLAFLFVQLFSNDLLLKFIY